MQTICIRKLRDLAATYPEIKRICINKAVPVYLLQMELERYGFTLSKDKYVEFQKVRIHLK